MSSPQQQRVVDSQKYMDRFHRYSGTGVPSPHQYDSASASGYSSFRARVGRPQSTTLETLAVMSGILESPSSSHPLVERLRTVLLSRGVDGLGFAELQRRIYMMDRDGSHVLSLDEFKIAMQSEYFTFLTCLTNKSTLTTSVRSQNRVQLWIQ